MSAKFFMLYGDTVITPHVADEAELFAWARRNDVNFDQTNYASINEALKATEQILLAQYNIFGLFSYTPQGMAEFIAAASAADELAGLYALELAEEYLDEVRHEIALALTEAQKKVMERVQFPIAGDVSGFQSYQETIASIRRMSVSGLAKYVKSGDSIPE